MTVLEVIMTQFKGMGETLYRCKACGYMAKSGAGLAGHIQLAHGERAAGKAELTKIGEEIAGLRGDLVAQLSKVDNSALQSVADELHELNGHLAALRAQRQASNAQPPPSLPMPTARWVPTGEKALSLVPPSQATEDVGTTIAKIAAAFLIIAFLDSLSR